ncbi:hypothetical protein C8Q76DRAFT_381486 [Earliella scabrosa]|nr:hypothetical protein C8Q76DRAFT_381486 [Earliella scabrosa]
MHEFVPQRQRIFTIASDEDEEYDVYDFYPSQNHLYQRVFPSSDWVAPPTAPIEQVSSSSDLSDALGSVESLEILGYLHKLPPSPIFSYDSSFVFPDPSNNEHGIRSLGYSKLFRRGLWAKSSCITRRVDALFLKARSMFRALKARLAHPVPRRS